MNDTHSLTQCRTMLDAKDCMPTALAEQFCPKGDTSFVLSLYERAKERAFYAMERIEERSARDTTGVPIAIEDSLVTKDLSTQCGSPALATWLPSYDATLVRKLDGYGALLMGKTVVGEFALGVDSSLGAAKAVYGHECVAALGTGVLLTAAHFGCVALAPSFGTVTRYGMIAAAPSLKQVGTVAHSAVDCGIMMDAISDFDPYDPAMVRPNCYSYTQEIGKPLGNATMGFVEGSDPSWWVLQGCDLTSVALPTMTMPTYYANEGAEAVFTLAKFSSQTLGDLSNQTLGDLAKQALEIGNYTLAKDLYRSACAARGEITRHLEQLLQVHCALLCPVSQEIAMLSELTGLPCVSCGGGLLLGRRYDEVHLLQLADAWERGHTL